MRDEDFTEFTYTFDHARSTVTFKFMTEAGFSHEIEQSSDLAPGSWSTTVAGLPTSATLAGTLCTHTLEFTGEASTFFRLRRVETP
ncbi:MAG: hypothetical protein ACQCXQ_05170 [Verrucomicrobiales bacterium]|nr:hypothetical protein [Verrucomicrobiota bacterium JB025]